MRNIIIAIVILMAACKKAPDKQGPMSIVAADLPILAPGNIIYSSEVSKPTLTFNDSLHPEINSPSYKTRLSFEPLMKGQGNAPFVFTQGSTTYGAWQPDEVFMLGWNFNPGGGPIIPGQPGIGLSFEQHYKPVGQDLGLTEHHTFWIRPDGRQTRVASYTINNALNDIDYYQTLSRNYQKAPYDDHVYHAMHLGTNGDVIESFSGPSFDYQWTYDSQGVQLTSINGKPFYFRGPLYIEMPGGTIFHQKYIQFAKQAAFDAPVIFNSGVTFSGPVTFKQKPVFEMGIDNRKP